MIKVDEVSDGVFQVAFTGIDLRSISHAAGRIVTGRDQVLHGWITFVVNVWEKVDFLEGSQDGLD